ncbi:MAG: hypothetical protein H7Y07_05980, partial [Pyrinomonadaceae bacterium]|nr:hypothetical protein [Sphingobacteriaceae bacterium]
LINGSLPWWAGARFSDVEKLVGDVVKFNSTALQQMLFEEAAAETVRDRIVYQLTSPSVALLITVLQPAEASFIVNYHTQAVKIQQTEKLVKYQTLSVEKVIWRFILDYLFMLRGGVFNRKEFVRQHIFKMSAHFNLAYPHLLNLFFKVLNPNPQLALGEEFQKIIRELEREEKALIIPANSKKQGRDSIPIGKSDFRSENADSMMLISYYLKTGSLPPNKESLSKGELATLAYELWKNWPQTFKTYLLNERLDSEVIKRLAALFSDESFQAMIQLLNPHNELFIGMFLKEIFKIQLSKLAVKIESKEFKMYVRQFVLDYLLFESSEVFTPEKFLKNAIKQLSHRYTVSPTKLLGAMIKAFNTQAGAEIFQQLKNIQRQDHFSKAQSEDDPSTDNVSEGDNLYIDERTIGEKLLDPNNESTTISLRNYLRYWTMFGYFPWWGTEWLNASPEKLFEQLIHKSPDDAILLLKIAGSSDSEKLRVLNQLSVNTILLLLTLPKPISSFADIFQLLRELAGLNNALKVPNRDNSSKLVLLVFWESLIENNYSKIDEPEFLQRVLFSLSEYLQLPPRYLLDYVSTLKTSNQEHLNALIDNFGRTLKEKSSTYEEYANFINLVNRYQHDTLNHSLFTEPSAENEAAETKALSIIQFFLKNNKLPSTMHFEGREESSTLKQLLIYLYHHHRNELETLLKQKKYNLEAAMQLHEAFSTVVTIEEEQVKKLLSHVLETDLVEFMEYTIGIVPGTSTLQDLIMFNPDTINTTKFLQTLLKYRSALGHIAVSVSNQAIYKLFIIVKGGWEENTELFLDDLYLLLAGGFTDTLERERFASLFKEYILLYLSGRITHSTRESYIKGLFSFIAVNRNQSIHSFGMLFKSSAMKYSGTNEIAELVLAELRLAEQRETTAKYLDHIWQNADKLAKDKLIKRVVIPEETKLRESKEESLEPILMDNNMLEVMEEKDKIYVNNSGLVLLHPFLHTYFQRLEMIESGQFVSEDVKMRAVHLLQYLVFGTDEHPEHELVLNKILCGMPLPEPVPLQITLTEKEKAVSAELLTAVISRWDKLKNTSVESLRASFLQRQGALEKTGDIWTLNVEKRGYDVLLETLPWSVGMIKTSMMDNFLNVEWI